MHVTSVMPGIPAVLRMFQAMPARCTPTSPLFLAVRAGQRALEASRGNRIAPVRDARDLHRRPGVGTSERWRCISPTGLRAPTGRIVVMKPSITISAAAGHFEIDRLALHQLGRLAR